VVVVDLVTDFEPGVEFTSVRTEILHSGGGGSTAVVAAFGDDYLAGQRVAELDGVSGGSTTTRVFLLDGAGETVIERTIIVAIAGDTGFTVLATRSCLALVCPRATDAPTSSECVGGQCVDERCTVESSEFCGDPGCTADADCAPGPVACARQVCVASACLAEGLDAMCAANEYCDVSAGCTARPAPPMDAGSDALVDGGMDATTDADAAIDAPADTRIDVDPPGPGDFVLVAGDTVVNASGVYAGAPGAVAPGARRFPMYFEGPGNTLYLFGGRGYDADGTRGNLDDMWRFDVATSEWTFLGGGTTAGGLGDWGISGMPAATNRPSARNSAVMVTDGVGNAWLYGGSGIDSTGASGTLADLWRFEIASGTWTWMAGPSTAGAAPVFGIEGMPAAGNQPGQRLDYGLFTDGGNDVWLFGGKEVGFFGWRNDLWRFQPASGLWTWFGGYNDAPSYGTRGVPAASNMPGRRHIVAWGQDGTSRFYVFGGEGNGATGEYVLSDLWRYEPATDLWTWLSGTTTVGDEPIYGTRGVPDGTSRPGGRFTGRLSVDAAGRVWVHGGFGRISGGDNALADLWVYDPPADQWTWVAGGNVGNEITTLGAGGGPGSREGQAMWFDSTGTLFVFGGLGFDTAGTRGDMADIWRLSMP